MTRWERFRYWLAGLIWPGLLKANKKVEELEERLKNTHLRMQELYWEGKAKEMAEALIAGLLEELRKADPDNSYLARVLEARGPARPPEEIELHPAGLAFDHPGRSGSWKSAEEAPSQLTEGASFPARGEKQ